ncbi:MAG: M20 family metallo-hydrolase [Edaphocola sp.]
MVATPSFSKEENGTADIIENWLSQEGIGCERYNNNVVARSPRFDPEKPTILLNSHHDTVRPAKGYTKDPYVSTIENGKLYGLGSNDAGGALVSLLATFVHFYNRENLPFNLVLAAAAEEEISGIKGISSIVDELGKIDCAIVGEPSLMQMAVAERGLMVCDAVAKGVSGHAARKEGVNAIYKAMKDINWISKYSFERVSPFLGEVSMCVTCIETDNKAHNVVPDQCRFTIDLRLNECYTHEEVLHTLKTNMNSEVTARSTRLRSTIIGMEHPLVKAGLDLGMEAYGSPTMSDKALMPFPALKLGPGDSARSHTADEFIYVEEIKQGIGTYVALLERVAF